METRKFMNSKNSKNDPHKFALNLLQGLDLRSSNKHVAFQILSICYTWKDIRKATVQIQFTRNNSFNME